MSINIIPKPSYPDLKRASDYTEDLKHDRAKVAVGEDGQPMTGGFNFVSDDRPTQLVEFQAHLNRNRNAKAKALQHLVFSYANGIVVTHAQARRHIQIYLEVLGAGEQMGLYDCHWNTENFHTHYLSDRLSNEQDQDGNYRILNNGLFKKRDKKGRLRTDESICRQVAIARICREEGWVPPPGLAYDENGKPIPRQKKKSSFDGIPSKSDRLAAIGWEIFLTSKEHREPVERLLEQGIKIQLVRKSGKLVGAKLVGNDGTSCGFARMNPNEKGLFKRLSKKFALAPDDEYGEPDWGSPFQAEEQLRAYMRPIFLEPARFGNNWDYLLAAVEAQDACIERSGGGLVVVRDGVKVTTSSISNRCSLSKLERILGTCPILKSLPDKASAREVLIRDASSIIEPLVERGKGLHDVAPAPQGVLNLERRRAWVEGQIEASQRSREAQEAEVRIQKERMFSNLSLFAAIAQFIKLKHNPEVKNVHTDSDTSDQKLSMAGEVPRAKQVLVM